MDTPVDLAREDRLEQLFEDALALPPERRAAFVAACGAGPDLRAELQALVAHAAAAHDFVERVAGPLVAHATGLALDDARTDADEGVDTLVGQRVAHFRILARLGGGGMGRVYKALDLHLDRTVALKFLPPELGTDEYAKRRLVHEGRAASALDHPNICAIHEVGETDAGQLFIAMACYDGETLKRKIARGPLSVPEALDYVAQTADALQRAHDAGIVHRDVKPANVMVTHAGQVKLVDFGLAKGAGAEVTREGVTRGTVAYMSPEQTRGETLDARTDVWSLGAVLYELLTGRRPFRAESDETLIYAIRHDEPQPVRALRPEVPAGVAALVSRCLEKAPGRRYPRADALLADVRTLQQGGTVRRPVRPVRLLRYGGGAALLLLSLLVVAARLTRPTLAARPVDPEAFALYLQSARTTNDSQRRAALEQAISKDSTFALAYAHVAHLYMWAGEKARAERAIAKALALDPSLSEAYDALGLLREWRDWDWPTAEAALRRAIELNPHNSRAHHELGQLLMRERRCDEAVVEELRAALEDPRTPGWQGALGEVYLYCRRYDDAIREFEKTLAFASDSMGILLNVGDAYFYQGQYARALATYRKAGWVPGWAYVPLGSRREAVAQIDTLLATWAGGASSGGFALAAARNYVSLGERAEALALLERLSEQRAGILVYLGVHPHLDPLRGEPRFRALLEKVRLIAD